MLVPAPVVTCLFIDVFQGVIAHVASDHHFRLEAACPKGQNAGLDIVSLFRLEKVLDNVHHARVGREHQTGAGSLQCLGNKPGETHVVADPGDQGNLAFQRYWDHGDLTEKTIGPRLPSQSKIFSTGLAKWGKLDKRKRGT